MMRAEKMLWSFAVLSAVYLLTGPLLGGRTVWSHRGGIVRDGAGWDWLMAVAGAAAIGGLLVGAFLRPRVTVPVLGATVASAAFAIAAFAAGNAWIDLLRGTTRLQASGDGGVGAVEVLYPSRPQSFAIVATAATALALVLVVSWVKPAEDEW